MDPHGRAETEPEWKCSRPAGRDVARPLAPHCPGLQTSSRAIDPLMPSKGSSKGAVGDRGPGAGCVRCGGVEPFVPDEGRGLRPAHTASLARNERLAPICRDTSVPASRGTGALADDDGEGVPHDVRWAGAGTGPANALLCTIPIMNTVATSSVEGRIKRQSDADDRRRRLALSRPPMAQLGADDGCMR